MPQDNQSRAVPTCITCTYYEPYGDDYVWGYCNNGIVTRSTTMEVDSCPQHTSE